ncbi:MAG: 2Fe-2S iron-sulfur cluster-binding protein [Thermoflexales bacterium]
MPDTVHLTIDGHGIETAHGATVLEAARAAGAEIPTLCYDPRCAPNGLCRMCVVESQGARLLQAACVTRAVDGMTITTESPRIIRARKTVLEMLAASTDLSETPDALAQIAETGADITRFAGGRVRRPPVIADNPMFVRDYAKCILCWRCVQVCADDAQYAFAINFDGRGFDTRIGTFFDKPLPETSCVFCGQCVGVCPSGALKPLRAWELEQRDSAAP